MNTAVGIFLLAILFVVIGCWRAHRATSDGDYVFLLWWAAAAITAIAAVLVALAAFIGGHHV